MPYRMKKTSYLLAAAFFCAAAVAAPPAIAATTITSSGYGVSADLRLASFAGVAIAPVAPVAGAAAPAYNLTNTVASLNQSLALGALGAPFSTSVNQAVGTGILTSTANSPFPVTPTGTGSSTVNNLATGLTTTFALTQIPVSILSLGATTVTSTSSVSGVGPITASGSSQITGLTLTGSALTLPIDGSAFVNPAPNTVLLNILGLKIILNEQLFTGNGTDTTGITTNAIHISYTDFLVAGGLLNGNVFVGHSAASIAVDPAVGGVPEPAVWLQLIGGFGLTGALLRNRRRVVVAAPAK